VSKVFSLAQAAKTLPLVKKIVEDILHTGQNIRELSAEMEKPEEDPQIHHLMDQLDELFDEMESLGCYYKDWNFAVGLVDFPAKLDGRDIMLCWRSDEAKILYYHDAEAGFSARQLIPEGMV
jgi:hypothetical protein